MADHADNDGGDGDNIFVYRGGRAPQHITHARIDTSIDEIEDDAFENCENLLQVDTHDGIRKVGKQAFYHCRSLPQINLKSVVEIGQWAFRHCFNLADVEFGDRLETIGHSAFYHCSLQHLKLPSIITIGTSAFYECTHLTDVELSERLETIGAAAFSSCRSLQRIAIPLKRDLFEYSDYDEKCNQFDGCKQLIRLDLVGGIHKTATSLHMESWRTEMLAEIDRINQVLPNTRADEKAEEIRQLMESAIDRMDHYKAAHCMYVKEGITLLELALWKAKLGEKEDHSEEGTPRRTVKAARRNKRITCGADMVIKNVLPFLQLE